MFSKAVEYALRAVVHLAYEAPNARTNEQIAAATRVDSVTYLSKVLQGLRDHGIVRSQRGVGGGVALAKRPEDLTILDVVNAVEPIRRIKTCPLGLETHAFRATTLAEVLGEPTQSPPLCEVGTERVHRRPVGNHR
jgi:Rrf2 family transcriptional regulator, nitric oxide-sensitive transcriptional repressor